MNMKSHEMIMITATRRRCRSILPTAFLRIILYLLIVIFTSSQITHAFYMSPPLASPANPSAAAFAKQQQHNNNNNNMLSGLEQLASAFEIKHNTLSSMSCITIFFFSIVFPSSDAASILLSSGSSSINSIISSSSAVVAEGGSTDAVALKSIAEALGYLIGAASLLLYTPIAVRIIRTKSADGLAGEHVVAQVDELYMHGCIQRKKWLPIRSLQRNIRNNTGISNRPRINPLPSKTHQRLHAPSVPSLPRNHIVGTILPLAHLPYGPPNEWIDAAQILSIALSASALVPQLKQNFDRRSSGDYSPITASLASVGCAIRLFTTMELADGDVLLLCNYGVALVLNLCVLFQIVLFGMQVEGKSLVDLFLADVKSTDVEI